MIEELNDMKLKDFEMQWPGLHGRENSAKVQVQIFENIHSFGGKVVILTEPIDNDGCSVTNGVEQIASRVVAGFDLVPLSTVFVEHYLAGEHRGDAKETFDVVTFDVVSDRDPNRRLRRPHWIRSDWETTRTLITDDPAATWADL